MIRGLLACACVLVLLALVVPASSQSATVMAPGDGIAFDYLDADLVTYQIDGFQASWDGGAWQSIGTVVAFRDAQTQGGASSYKALPPFTNGTHTVSFRACNAQGCGGGSATFPFAYSEASVPSKAPFNMRVVS